MPLSQATLTRRSLLGVAAFGLTSGTINVRERPYRAAANGRADDTLAIQRAMDDARKRGGGIVFLPAGEYHIAGHLAVPAGVTLMGVARAPQTWRRGDGSVLLAVEGAGMSEGAPFITLDGNNATIEGLAVFYPNQVLSEEPVSYPWCIASGKQADNVAIVNCLLVNPYQGVDFATNSAHRHFISGLYGQPLLKGIWVDKCYDIGRVKNVHLWPFWTQDKRIVDFTTARGTTFIFQRTDWEVVEDIFCWGYNTGAEFSSSEAPREHPNLKGINGMNGQMTNVNFDNVNIGIDISGTQPYAVHITNLNIANAGAGDDHIGIWGRNSARSAELSVRGASFWGDIRQALRWEIPGTVTMSDSRIVNWNYRLPAVELLAGNAMIHDCSFANPRERPGTAVRIGPEVDRAMVYNNQLNGHSIVNEGGGRAALSNNQA